MNRGGGLAVLIFATVAVVITGATVGGWFVARWAAHKWALPHWIMILSLPIALALGTYVALWQVFSDLGPNLVRGLFPPKISVTVPAGTDGIVYIFFDSKHPALNFSKENRLASLSLGPTGSVITGTLSGMSGGGGLDMEFFSVTDERTPLFSAKLVSSVGHLKNWDEYYFWQYYVGTKEGYEKGDWSSSPAYKSGPEKIYKRLMNLPEDGN